MKKRILFIGGLVSLIFACNFPSSVSNPKVNLLATLSASTPLAVSSATIAASDGPAGKIVLTCQIFKDISSDQICIVNADGSGYRRLTSEDDTRHYYPSLSPDGRSVVYSGFNIQSKHYEIYEMDLSTGETRSLTYAFGDLNGPEISPDGSTIVFTRFFTDSDHPTIWLMDRDGSNFRQVSNTAAWDPTWSPDGKQILFASYAGELSQLFIINADGTGLHQVSNFPALRGRSDWSPQNLIVTYSGKAWHREVFGLDLDGSNQHQISPGGGNSQGPSFSPDGQWIAFTAYFDHDGDIHGCEIYIIKIDGTSLQRLTNNDYCDYQPRWGP